MNREQLRHSYKPHKVKLLFVGESPPASGRFFYARNSGLYRAMLRVFAEVDCAINEDNFLAAFQSAGCYLFDLCPDPVDRLCTQQRRAVRTSSEKLVTESITRLQPDMIATLLRSVERNVANSIMRAQWKGPLIHLPYPGRWEHLRRQFAETLEPVINRLLQGRAPVVVSLPDGIGSHADSSSPCPTRSRTRRKGVVRKQRHGS